MSATPWDCPDCGDTHPRGCHAHTNVKDDDGRIVGRRACRAPATTGLTVCYRHGGASKQSKAKAAAARTEQAAAREVARLGARLDIHPAAALIDLVQWTAGEVAYWREVVVQLEQGDGQTAGHRALTWGVTKIKDGGDDAGTTTAAAPHVAYTMLERSSDRLANYAAAALRAGVDERRVQLAERHGALVASVIRGVIEGLVRAILTALRGAGITDVETACALVERAVAESVPTIVPEQLRLLTANPNGA